MKLKMNWTLTKALVRALRAERKEAERDFGVKVQDWKLSHIQQFEQKYGVKVQRLLMPGEERNAPLDQSRLSAETLRVLNERAAFLGQAPLLVASSPAPVSVPEQAVPQVGTQNEEETEQPVPVPPTPPTPPQNQKLSWLQSIMAFCQALASVGYEARRREAVCVYSALRRWAEGATCCCILLLGPPGTGKTFLPVSIARILGARYMESRGNAWTTDETLIRAVDVNKFAESMASGTVQDIRQLGFLAQIALASQTGQVVACLDEQDKTPEEAEALLLRFLETGEVSFGDGTSIHANLSNIIIFGTSNQYRPHSEAYLRRFTPRITMQFLDPTIEARLVSEFCPLPIAEELVRQANVVRGAGFSSPSVAELKTLAQDLRFCESEQDVQHMLEGGLIKIPQDEASLLRPGRLWEIMESTPVPQTQTQTPQTQTQTPQAPQRRNKFEGVCVRCQAKVQPLQGFLGAKNAAGKYDILCVSCGGGVGGQA